jgi:hypothetical protein
VSTCSGLMYAAASPMCDACLLEQPAPHLECERGRSHHGVEHNEPQNKQKRNPDRRTMDSASGQFVVDGRNEGMAPQAASERLYSTLGVL